MKRKSVLLLLAPMLLLAGRNAKPSGSQAAASKYNQLTVYSALPDQEIPTYFNAFEKDTGIHINYVRLSAGEMMARIAAEKANPQASVMHAGSSDTYVAADKEGLLEPYQSPELVNIPSQYHDAGGIWNPIYVGAIAFACNTEWFKENNKSLPTSWADLIKPEFKGQISLAHPATSGTSYTILATLIQLFGEDRGFNYLRQLDANVRQYTKAGAAPPQEAALGEAAVAITFSHDGLKPKMEGYPVELVFPSEGTGYEVGGVALIKNGFAEEQENARRFIDWFMSVRCQELFIDSGSNRLPVNTKARYTPGLVSLDKLPIIDYDAVWAGQNKAAFVKKFDEQIKDQSNLK
ncbi:MAG: ABC transporter substrate-binding protein [Treponema sp.]|jgi:iron(III) transport system substrate-binding protein|nr:ABC transporter substrate-binding protein [Treponema sp.]